MLYLNSPYFVINGVSVFPDDKDPLQFYYLPMMPHLTMVTDPKTNVATPQLQLIEYEGAAGTGGFLNFDVNIGIDQDALSEVSSQLQQQAKLTGQPRLSPVTFVDGSVDLLILGAQSASPPATGGAAAPSGGPAGASSGAAATAVMAPAASGPQFVIKVQNATKPALYGDNQATFSVQLDQYGATVLEAALQGEMAPVAVIYSLQFLGLRPAFHVQLTADWNRVQTYLDTQYGGGFLFVSSDIEKTVDKLIEDQVINIQVSSYTTDSDLGATGVSDRDRAVSECYELVKNNFFQSSLAPPDPNKPDDWDKFTSTVKNLSDIALAGPLGQAGYSYKHIDLSQTDQKSLDFNLTEQTAVLRTIFPQGHLNGLLSELKPGTGLGQFVVKVDLDNPYFQRRTVNVVTHADFAGDSIASIDVNLTYNGSVQSVSLTGAASQGSCNWSSVLSNGQMQRPVSYTYTVNFMNVDTTQRPNKLTSAPQTVTGDVLDIEPRGDVYGVTVIPVRAFGFPWDRYPSVEVECRYVDAKNAINEQPSAIMTSANPEVDWPLFMCDPSLRSFQYRLTYSLVSGGTSVSPWVTTSASKIDVVDPFPSKLTLNVIAALDWTQFQEALVFVAYPSKSNPAVQQTYTLTASNAAAPPFTVDRQDPTQNLIYYEAQLVHTNGQIWTIPGSVTSDQYLMLQNNMKGHQILSIAPQQVDFTASQIGQIVVGIRYVDATNAIDLSESVTLATAADVRSFAYDYVDPNVAPQYRADIQLTNGQTKSIDWTPIAGNALVIPLNNLS